MPARVIDGRAVAHRAHLSAGRPTADIELSFGDVTAATGAPVA